MRRCSCVGQGPLSSQPPFRSPVRDYGISWASSLSSLLSMYGWRDGSMEGLAWCMAGRDWAPSTACLGSQWAEVRAGPWGWAAGASGGSCAEELAAGISVEQFFSIMDFCSPHQTTTCFNLVYGLDFFLNTVIEEFKVLGALIITAEVVQGIDGKCLPPPSVLLTARMLSQVVLVLEICFLPYCSPYTSCLKTLLSETNLVVSGNWQHLKLPMWPWRLLCKSCAAED